MRRRWPQRSAAEGYPDACFSVGCLDRCARRLSAPRRVQRLRSAEAPGRAHLGAAVAGMLIAILLEPSVLAYNYFPILVILIPCMVFIYIIIKMPHYLFVDNLFYKRHNRSYTIEDRYNTQKTDMQKRVDQILEKIHQKGMSSLTKKEKDILDEYSKTTR